MHKSKAVPLALFRPNRIWLVFFVTMNIWWRRSCAFYLEGSKNTFAQFPRWFPGANGSLELAFKTREPEGLLLYTDDGGSYEFFELKIVEGTARLRYNLGGGARLLTVGKNLNDGEFHKVRVQRRNERTELVVDAHMEGRSLKTLEYEFGSPSGNSFVWIGGLPDLVARQVSTRLTLQVATLEPTFQGEAKDLVYTGPDGVPRTQAMIASQGVHESSSAMLSVCDKQNSCRNGGRCVPSESGPKCDCTFIGYEGLTCEKEIEETAATFRGKEFLGWDLRRLGGEPLAALSDVISLSFKTRHPTGLLFFTGDGKEYVNIALKGGGIIVTVDMGGDPLEVNIKPEKVRLDDNQWHTIVINRRVKEITDHTSFCSLSVSVDGIHNERRTTAGPFSQLSSSKLQLGGADHPALLPGAKTRTNFVGCLSKVVYRTDSIRLPLLEMARNGHPLLHLNGQINYMCQEVDAADPISFSTKESYLDGPDNGVVNFLRSEANLVLPTWETIPRQSIRFKLRTTEPDGLLMFNGGTVSAKRDFFALELLDGHLNLHLNLGSGSTKVKVSIRRLDDGLWHEITLSRQASHGTVAVDEVAHDFVTQGDNSHLDLGGPLYVGGVGDDIEVPPELWTGRLRKGYVGCMRDLVVNDRATDLASYSKKQDSGSIFRFCHNDGGSCLSTPCMHGGRCQQGWGRFICDCADTSFIGPICAKDAATLSMNGSQHLQLTASEDITTQAEEISFRFRTQRPLGLLMTTMSPVSSDKLELALQSGSLRLTVKLASREKVMYTGHGLNDDRWHTVRFARRATILSLQIDKEQPIQDNLDARSSILEYRNLYVGMVPNNFSTWTSDIFDTDSLKEKNQNLVQPFSGLIQSFNFNGQYLFELARTGHLPNVQVTASFGKTQQVVHHPVTFKSSAAFVALPQLRAYSSTNVYFQFKTLQPSGLIMYNAGKGHDFLAVELVLGHVHLVFNLGDGAVRVRDTNRASLNDNRWHTVTVTRRGSRSFTLMVDDNVSTVDINGKNLNLNLQGYLYLGGVATEMFTTLPRLISRTGFQGCLASIDLNGDVPDPSGKDVPVTSNHVIAGCDGPSTKCREDACANGGTCNQQWNSYTCNCDMTSFTGPTCSDESTAYEFGPGTGLVTFEYPEGRWPNAHRDLLAMGFMTTQKDDSTVLRLDSANSNDFMELEIVDGNMYLVYNLGTEDHPIGEEISRINDGVYHVLKFTRSGPNATLQLDNYDVKSKNPKDIKLSDLSMYKKLGSWTWHGHQLSVFNGQSRMQIGGRRSKRSVAVERPYQGIVSGLVLNGERPLDLAAERDSRVTVEGDVHLLMTLPKQLPLNSVPSNRKPNPWQQTPGIPGPTPGEGDDLVFSGAGSNCDVDDEDQCIPIFETGSGDDLITPVYIPATTYPPQKNINKERGSDSSSVFGIGAGGRPCDDEEDCYIGSGSGEFNTDDGGLTDMEKGDDLEFHVTPRPMLEPDVIHSEENGLVGGSNRGQYHGRMTTSTTTTTWNQPPPSPPPRPSTTTSPTTTTTTTRRPTRRPYYYPTTTTSTTETYQYFGVLDYDEDYRLPEVKNNDQRSRDNVPEIIEDIQSDSAKQTALIISIVAGVLIVIILIILLWLKCKGSPDPNYKVEENKNYRTLSQGPTVVANGQGNGLLKAADRRPVKKQSKDVKEWYV